MLKHTIAAAVLGLGLFASVSSAGTNELKVVPAGRTSVYTHIVNHTETTEPRALTGETDRPQTTRYEAIRVGSRVVALQPVSTR